LFVVQVEMHYVNYQIVVFVVDDDDVKKYLRQFVDDF